MAKKRIEKIDTIDNIGLEMRRIYRLVKRKEVDDSHAKTLIHILNMIVNVTRDTNLEQRMDAFEARHNEH